MFLLRFLFTWRKTTNFSRPPCLIKILPPTSTAYWTLVVPRKQPSNSDLLCAPFHLAGIEIVMALDHPNLRGELAEFGLLSNLVRDLSGIFMNSIGQGVALFSFAGGDDRLNIPHQRIDMVR